MWDREQKIEEYCTWGQVSFRMRYVFNMSNMDVGREKNQALEKYKISTKLYI